MPNLFCVLSPFLVWKKYNELLPSAATAVSAAALHRRRHCCCCYYCSCGAAPLVLLPRQYFFRSNWNFVRKKGINLCDSKTKLVQLKRSHQVPVMCAYEHNKDLFGTQTAPAAADTAMLYMEVGTFKEKNCWTYSHHRQIADKNPSKRWNGEFWGFRSCIGFGLAVPPLPHVVFRVCLYTTIIQYTKYKKVTIM